ncbi:MAG: acylphosphatase [Euryarchaeota archaeon]|nr:acylphosphatase [Euryarchaeota archaeon]
MALVRVKFIVSGEVQKVGYRFHVYLEARKQGITGTVENLKDGTVRVVAEGEEEDIQMFLEAIRIEEHPICVRDIEPVSEEEIKKRAHRDFAIVRARGEGDPAVLDRLDLGIYHFRQMAGRMDSVERHKVSQYLEETSNHLAEISKTNQKTAEHLAHLTELVGKIAEEKAQRK